MNIFCKEVTQCCPYGIIVFQLSFTTFSPNSFRALAICQLSRSKKHSIKAIFEPARCWWWVNNQNLRHFII